MKEKALECPTGCGCFLDVMPGREKGEVACPRCQQISRIAEGNLLVETGRFRGNERVPFAIAVREAFATA